MYKDALLDNRLTYAEVVDAVERWYVQGTLDFLKYRELKESLALAFGIGCSEYLARRTEDVCGK